MPWADALYGCDWEWWKQNNGAPEFEGMKLSVDANAVKRWPEINKMELNKHDDRLELLKSGTVGWSGNSGFQAYNLAIQIFQSQSEKVRRRHKKLILIGYDMSVERGLHWHGDHPHGMNNPKAANVVRWRRCLDATAGVVDSIGIQVINCSKHSALQNFPKMSLKEAMQC